MEESIIIRARKRITWKQRLKVKIQISWFIFCYKFEKALRNYGESIIRTLNIK